MVVPARQANPGAGLRLPAWSCEALILLATLLLLFTRLGVQGLWHSENRWAEITREMLLRGDFFHPTIGWEPYFDKPPLTYWLVAGAAALGGRLDEWATRFPSALSGTIVVIVTLWIGRRLWSAQVGRLAALLLLTSYGFLFWCRTASADMETVAAIMVAIAWYWKRNDRLNFGTFLGFYLIAFMGALTKGLLTVALPVLAVLPDIVARRRWRQILTPSHAMAAVIGLGVYLAPFWYASYTDAGSYGVNGLTLVFRENILRFFQPFDHKGPIYLYFLYLPVLLLPWTPAFLAALTGLFKIRREMDQQTRWLVWSAIVIFAFFTASGSRRTYYILPLLPFCTLMTAVVFVKLRTDCLETIRHHGIRAQKALFGIVLTLLLLGPITGSFILDKLNLALPEETLRTMPLVALGSLILGYAGYRLLLRGTEGQQGLRGLIPMAGIAMGLMGGYFCFQLPTVYRTERSFAWNLAGWVKGISPSDIGIYRQTPASLLFYMNASGPFEQLRDENNLRGFLAGGGVHVIVTRQRFADDLKKALPGLLVESPELAQEQVPWVREPDSDIWVAWLVSGPDRAAVNQTH